jgi:hypothetical protein
MNKYIALTLLCSTIAFGFGYSININISVDNAIDSYQLSEDDYNDVMSMAATIQDLNPDVSSFNIDELPAATELNIKTLDVKKELDSKSLLFTDTPVSVKNDNTIYSI